MRHAGGQMRRRDHPPTPRLRPFWVAVALAMTQAGALHGQNKLAERPMTVDDLFRSEAVMSAVASPDGKWIAAVIKRAHSPVERYQQGFLSGGEHSDVWLVRRDGSGRRNLTNGARDGAGYWNPVWSPDGEHLALLSTRGDDNVRAFVWRRGQDTLRLLSQTGVDFIANINAGGGNWYFNPMAWLSASRLMVVLLPPGTRPYLYDFKRRTARIASPAWESAQAGREPTASVLETGPGVLPRVLRTGQLALFDVTDERGVSIAAEIPIDETSSGLRFIVLSPSRHHAAVLTSNIRNPDVNQRRLSRSQNTYRLGIVSLVGDRPAARWIEELDPVVNEQFRHMVRWSPDESWLALFAGRTVGPDSAARLYVVDVKSGSARRLLPGGWENSEPARGRETVWNHANLVWTLAGEAVAYARPPASDTFRGASDPSRSSRAEEQRFDWWVLGNGTPINLTHSLTVVPSALNRIAGSRALAGLAGGALWRVDLASGKATNLTATLRTPVQAIVWPGASDLPGMVLGHVVVSAGDARAPELYVVELSTNGSPPRRIQWPGERMAMAGYVAAERYALFTSSDRVRVTDEAGNVTTPVALNSTLDPIAWPTQRLITYRGADGDSLSAVLLLPVGYQEGRRYPLVTIVYAGFVYHDTLSHADGRSTSAGVSEGDILLLTARGYAVLLPSMPLRRTNVASDPYLDIPKGVIPAVDKAIDLGVADPARLGIMGCSYGGYSTYAVVTYTTRFRAAIALCSFADLVSDYGTFRASDRYTDEPHLTLATPKMSEAGQKRMGTSPWNDLSRYIKNSPIFYLDRVETPLLIIHGDQDFIPIQQAEEVFTGLQRLGKRAQFVRYWGEWHDINSPANIRDMWQRIFRWFDTYLGDQARPAAVGARQ